MYYLDRGQGIPIVLLHGFLGNAFMWAPQITAFEDEFRLIAPDIWGTEILANYRMAQVI